MTAKRLPTLLAALALSNLAAAPLQQGNPSLFPCWESLLILLLLTLLIAVLILWNARQPLEYADSFAHGAEGDHGHDSQMPGSSHDDLAVIEGIGPKIKSILTEAGISTFAQLGDSNPAQLENILRQAGLRLGNPTTWPEQARLAEDGDWEGLQRLQDALKGGRRGD